MRNKKKKENGATKNKKNTALVTHLKQPTPYLPPFPFWGFLPDPPPRAPPLPLSFRSCTSAVWICVRDSIRSCGPLFRIVARGAASPLHALALLSFANRWSRSRASQQRWRQAARLQARSGSAVPPFLNSPVAHDPRTRLVPGSSRRLAARRGSWWCLHGYGADSTT